MIKVLEVVSSLALGGTEAFVMNLYRNIDKSIFQIDFICFSHQNITHDKEIIASGGSIYFLAPPGSSRIWAFERELHEIVQMNHGYDVIHAHCDSLNGVIMRAAARCGIQRRFSHAHCAYPNHPRNIFDDCYHKLKNYWARKYSDKMLACSREAFCCVYGKENEKQLIIHNGIEVNKFSSPDQNKVEQLREELHIPKNSWVIGNISRFDRNKNQAFIVDIVYELRQIGCDVFLLLVGPDAGEKENVSMKVDSLDLQDHIKLLPARSDVADLLGLMDACVIPSISEGLCISALEAQAAGKKVYLSDTVPKDADMGVGLVRFLRLTMHPKEWAHCMLEEKNGSVDKALVLQAFQKNEYDIQSMVSQMEQLYGRDNC